MPPTITVVGLGPGDPGLRTLATQRALDAAARILLRTRVHPGLDDLVDDPRVSDCDDLYERSLSFDDLYSEIAGRVIQLAEQEPRRSLVFAVPGHPRFGERSVRLITESAAERGIAVLVQAAVSTVDVVASAIGLDPLTDEAQLVDAVHLSGILDQSPFAGGLISIDPTRPCLLAQVYATTIATGAKLALSRLYPDNHPIVIVHAAGIPNQERLVHCLLFELDHQPLDHLTSVFIPPLPSLAAHRSPLMLQRVVAHLRTPEGCPWDRQQSHASLRDAVIEEAYETLDAIDAGDTGNLAEELGDLLLQVALHSQIAEEAEEFLLEDVYEHVNRKLIRRHPHVFADAQAFTPADVVTTWDSVKEAERSTSGKPPTDLPDHPLDRLPRSMPSLRRAATLLGPRKGSLPRPPEREQADAIGDALLASVQRAILAGLDPETMLDDALRRHIVAEDAGAAPAGTAVPLAGKVTA